MVKEDVQNAVDKLGLVLMILSTDSTDKEVQLELIKEAKKDLERAIRKLSKGEGN